MINRMNRSSFSSSMRTSRHATPAENESPARESSNEVSSYAVTDKIGFGRFTPEDMTPNGKIPIIISAKDMQSIRELKGQIKKDFNIDQANLKEELPLVSGIRVEVDPYNFQRLMKALPDNTSVTLDNKIRMPSPQHISPKIPDADNEERPALDITNSTLGINRLWDMGFTGKGIGIAVIDSGIHPHRDFDDRIKAFVDMHESQPEPYDPYGHGTHVAGIAAGSGTESAGKYRGVAPDADIIGIRITSVAEAIKGIQWAIQNKDKYNIKIINMSLGDFPIKSYKDDPWAQAAEKAWDEGILVVVAAGNEGPGEGSISTPGISPKVLTVGAIDDRNTPEPDDDVMAHFSSRGPTSPDGVAKPDVVAPGVEIFGPLSPNSTLDTPDVNRVGNHYIAISGSSMATPLVSGLAALLMQSNPDLTNDCVKKIIVETADKYISDASKYDQGAGVIDPLKAIQTAMKLRPAQEAAPPPQDDSKQEVMEMLIADNNSRKHHNQPYNQPSA